jgi:hypothetical protein
MGRLSSGSSVKHRQRTGQPSVNSGGFKRRKNVNVLAFNQVLQQHSDLRASCKKKPKQFAVFKYDDVRITAVATPAEGKSDKASQTADWNENGYIFVDGIG